MHYLGIWPNIWIFGIHAIVDIELRSGRNYLHLLVLLQALAHIHPELSARRLLSSVHNYFCNPLKNSRGNSMVHGDRGKNLEFLLNL